MVSKPYKIFQGENVGSNITIIKNYCSIALLLQNADNAFIPVHNYITHNDRNNDFY